MTSPEYGQQEKSPEIVALLDFLQMQDSLVVGQVLSLRNEQTHRFDMTAEQRLDRVTQLAELVGQRKAFAMVFRYLAGENATEQPEG